MKTSFITGIFIFGALLLTGCPQNGPELNLSSEELRKKAVRQMREVVFADQFSQYECWASGRMVVPQFKQLDATDSLVKTGSRNAGDKVYSTFTCEGLSGSVKPEEKAREIRNRVFYDGQGLIDEIYYKYSNALRNNRTKWSFAADIADIGFGGSIALTKGTAQTIRDLGTILTGFRAGRDSARLRFYDNQTTEIILDQMDASRSEVFLNFRDVDSKKSIGDYPIESVFRDLYRYFSVGSQTEAFKRIRRKTAANAELNENAILRITAPNPSQIYTTTQAISNGLIELGQIKDAFVREIDEIESLPASDATKASRAANVNDKLKKIFIELTTGSRKADFQAYFKAVRDKLHASETVYTNFLTSGNSPDELRDKLRLIMDTKTAVFEDYSKNTPNRELAASLLEEIISQFKANRL